MYRRLDFSNVTQCLGSGYWSFYHKGHRVAKSDNELKLLKLYLTLIYVNNVSDMKKKLLVVTNSQRSITQLCRSSQLCGAWHLLAFSQEL